MQNYCSRGNSFLYPIPFGVINYGKNRRTVTFEQLQNDILEMDKRPAEVFATALVSLGLITVNSGGEAKKKGEGIFKFSNL